MVYNGLLWFTLVYFGLFIFLIKGRSWREEAGTEEGREGFRTGFRGSKGS
jgi:hypothetical protein